MSDALSEMAVQVPADADAQATVTDFLDYTEYLPADLIRSLTLIRKLDESYLMTSGRVHELTKLYGGLPALPAHERPEPQALRSEISRSLNRAISIRGSSYAEASRLSDIVDHHLTRLRSIIVKLQALPQPPSRDPTPVPQSAPTQLAHRSRRGRNDEEDRPPAPRITLRLDGARSAAVDRSGPGGSRRKNRTRRVTVPGEVLPPPNPDSPPPSSETDWESPPPSPIPMPTSRVGVLPRPVRSTPGPARPPRSHKAPKIKPPKPPRGPRPTPGQGTNVHSAVAGISTSNALAMLKPPPENAVPGSNDAPWLRLTQWEMAKLRKRMKKNAVWNPSETMIRRELADHGRGPENYHAARARSAATGEPFIDASNIAQRMGQPGKKVLAEGEISADSLGNEEIQLSNRGMKLNEAKKLKKENLAREAAAQAAADAELAAQQLAEAGGDPNAVVMLPSEGAGKNVVVPATKGQEPKRSHKKRKPEVTPEAEAEDTNMDTTSIAKSKKRRRDGPAPDPDTASTTATTTTTVPLAAPGPTGTVAFADQSRAEIDSSTTGPGHRQASVVSKAGSPEVTVSRPRSRGTITPAEPQTTAGRDRPRRASTISTAPVEPPQPGRIATRRGKRPVPGRLTADGGEGGPAVTVGKRTAAPRKKNGAKRPKGETQEVDKGEDGDEERFSVDPDEPRYCICGDVSFGLMIQCENSDVSSPLTCLDPTWATREGYANAIRHDSVSVNGSISNVLASTNRLVGRLSGTVPIAARGSGSGIRVRSARGTRRNEMRWTKSARMVEVSFHHGSLKALHGKSRPEVQQSNGGGVSFPA